MVADKLKVRANVRVAGRDFLSLPIRRNRAAKLPVRVDFSIGIAAWKPGMDWQAMYQEADKELYIDKRSRHAARKKVSDARS